MSRVALVYKFGGLYSDMDVIALRPLVGATNFIALQDDEIGYLNPAIHRMRRHHPMLLRIMKHVAANYNGQTWAANGPTATSDLARLLGCDLKPVGLDRLLNATHNQTSQPITPHQTEECDWVALWSNAFMAVNFRAAYKLFLGPEKNETSPPIQTLYPDSLGLHFYNYMTRDKEVQSGSHMHRLASEFCPVVVKKHPLLASMNVSISS
ncbi:alpha-1,4-N-acetylglucosaminyltransferase-like [Hyalella azteca]|uniref:Alpha-1,4-N-acetylglucosaminyltransferase-like n=1 Tax=Hyalella azteca TaxID=294128 RepID=A0A8B7NQM7_HYAAZ|nr:alpha-1,4-N-acetylglucosaminyltransferase-like [Hyalella azteca]